MKYNILVFIKRIDFILFLVLSLLVVLFPVIDLEIASFFYDESKGGWHWKNFMVLQFIYDLFEKPVWLLALLCFFAVYNYKKYDRKDRQKKYIFVFLLCSLLLGPALLVNVILKDNSIGRARPSHLIEFGGEKTFTRAFQYSGQCRHNCSFVSGHAALGFFFIGLGWLFRSRSAFWLGVGIGALLGFIRIAQGGHFFSDVILAFWVVYFSNLWLGKKFDIPPPGGC